jgi:hypothetical protein
MERGNDANQETTMVEAAKAYNKWITTKDEAWDLPWGSLERKRLTATLEPLREAYEASRSFPESRPFPSKYPGVCAWSGQRVGRLDTIRRVAGEYVHEHFVNMACDPAWVRLHGESFSLDMVQDGHGFLLVNKHGEETFWTRKGDKIHRGHAWEGRSVGQFQRTFKAALAMKLTGRARE